MRDKFADVIYKVGKKNKKIAVLVADISPTGAITEFTASRKVKWYMGIILFMMISIGTISLKKIILNLKKIT